MAYIAGYDQVHGGIQASRVFGYKERIRMEKKIRDMEKESSCKTGERMNMEDKVKGLKNLVEELRANIKRRTLV